MKPKRIIGIILLGWPFAVFAVLSGYVIFMMALEALKNTPMHEVIIVGVCSTSMTIGWFLITSDK